MQYKYENIYHNSNTQIKIFTQTLEAFPYHWHDEVEILFILKGSVEIFVGKEITVLNEGDLYLINSNVIHYVKSTDYLEKAQLLIFQFNKTYLNKFDIDLKDIEFSLDSSKDDSKNKKVYNKIRATLAMMMNVVINNEEPNELLIKRYLLDLIIILLNKFNVNDKSKYTVVKQSENRLHDIVKYINDNYNDDSLTVPKIAGEFFLNSQYISRYFKENMGISVKTFLDTLRLNKSLNDLIITKDRIIDVAHRHGFADEKSYYRVFKSILGITPNQYREVNSIKEVKDKKINYLNINSKETLAKVFEYLRFNESDFEVKKSHYTDFEIETNEVIGELKNSWNKLITFGHATYGLRYDLLNQLKMIQQDNNFKYVRFHGIFSDEMLVYNENIKGDVYYNFNHIDSLLDSVLNLGITPFIELGFMPKKLVSSDNQVFMWSCYTSAPNNMEKWLNMIDAFVRHIINRYGVEEIEKWYFEFWNEPNLESVFWDRSREEFFTFFKLTYEKIKSINKNLKVGGFGNLKLGDFNSWINDFKDYSKEHGCYLDFFSFHAYHLKSIYDNIHEDQRFNKGIEYIKSNKSLGMSDYDFSDIVEFGDEDYINRTIKEMVDIGSKLNMNYEEYWLTEWNSSMNSRDLVHDTCFMAALIVKTCIENSNLVNGMGFWTFTDLFEEFNLEQPLFHGGFGLITYNGIKKASYHAYEFLNKLGKDIVYKDKGLIITKKNEDYQLLFYNYCHYNDLYRSLDYSQISQTNRYHVFKDAGERDYKLKLYIESGKYQFERYRVNRDEGSSFDAWVKMGAPDDLSKDGYRYLEKAAECGYKTWVEDVNDYISIETEVLPHEIQLIIVKKIY
ncbi:GH39 family glycosyl hydrolase [Clostridium hydrogeniformans]|uniref:GH39 family glycosyl hydrolase n=1 Tax=Clostridium hydrogeniformans TaxID=349933 RepID=UPI0004822287|nr:helix-turn-helix domain-containing protein [Clostridium hydrogeniformans]